MIQQKITPFLWFDKQAEDAAKFYTSIFKNPSIGNITRYGKEGYEFHHMPEGTAMTVPFELEGIQFTALNGGPIFKFNESVSFVIHCETKEEVDYYWDNLTADGGVESNCGWLKDKFGLSWQVVPDAMIKMLSDKDAAKAQRTMHAMMQMKKLDLPTLEKAYNGE
jgi:predicted 3-demethylubiquinone-9 3-methyltransferase (glyoxalase superfamily)